MSDCIDSLRISTAEMHTGGEPLRIIESGVPVLQGDSILQKISCMRKNHDHIRRFLMNEPRGHHDMYGTMRVEPDIPGADIAFIFLHNEGYSTMCGHAIIALGRYCVDKGLVRPTEPETLVNIQCPCGLVPTYVHYKNGCSGRVRFHSVPSFVFAKEVEVNVPEIDLTVHVDIAYGGAFYAFITAQKLGIEIGAGKALNAVGVGQAITDATKKAINLEHPDSPDLAFLYGTVIVDLSDMKSKKIVRQMTIFADKELDRSPTGSATSAHIALLFAKGQLGYNEELTFQSAVTDSKFLGKCIKPASCGKFDGVTAEVAGNAYYVGHNIFTVEPDDPLKGGFIVK